MGPSRHPALIDIERQIAVQNAAFRQRQREIDAAFCVMHGDPIKLPKDLDAAIEQANQFRDGTRLEAELTANGKKVVKHRARVQARNQMDAVDLTLTSIAEDLRSSWVTFNTILATLCFVKSPFCVPGTLIRLRDCESGKITVHLIGSMTPNGYGCAGDGSSPDDDDEVLSYLQLALPITLGEESPQTT